MQVRALDPGGSAPLVRRVIGADMCRVDERDDGFPGRASVGDSPSRGRAGQDGSVGAAAGSGSGRAADRVMEARSSIRLPPICHPHHEGEGETGLWAACGRVMKIQTSERGSAGTTLITLGSEIWGRSVSGHVPVPVRRDCAADQHLALSFASMFAMVCLWCVRAPPPPSGRANDLQHVAGVWEAQRSFCKVREP